MQVSKVFISELGGIHNDIEIKTADRRIWRTSQRSMVLDRFTQTRNSNTIPNACCVVYKVRCYSDVPHAEPKNIQLNSMLGETEYLQLDGNLVHEKPRK
jgi:hypothetical protein